MKTIVSLMSILLLVTVANQAQAHSRLIASSTIKIRSTNAGVKMGPCGGLPRNPTPSMLSGGQNLTVAWEETIYHPGRFEFYFSSANDQNFTLLKTVENTQAGLPVPHQFSTTLTLPNVDCQACTLQMIQVMAENPAAPTYYYSCADFQLKSNGSTTMPTPASPVCPAP